MDRPLDVRAAVSALAAAIAVALACGPPPRSSPVDRLMAGVSPPQRAIEESCRLTAVRCTACHDIDRVLAVRPAEPLQWEQTIARMRRMRGSGISRPDGDAILRCLVYRSFGARGLRDLDAPAAPAADVVDEPHR